MSLKDKRVVFTGFRDNTLKMRIEAAGGKVVSDVSAITNILIAEGDKAKGSEKSKKAAAAGVQVLSKDAFIKKYLSGNAAKQAKNPFYLFDRLFGKKNASVDDAKAIVPPSFPADKITKTSEYLVHDNGGRPFKTVLTKDTVAVYKKRKLTKQEYDDWDNVWPTIPYDIAIVKPTKYLKVFVGKDKNYLTKRFEGSSILVQLTKKKYLHIGSVVSIYEIDDEITGYCSSVGNSDVMYPYAIGEKHTYLFLDNTYIPNDMINDKDPYTQVYAQNIPNIGIQEANKLHQAHKLKYKLKMKVVEKRN
jgi:hypothetical protein